MEAQYKCRNGRLLVKVEAGDQKTLFERIAETDQVFDAATNCGICKGADLSYRVRTVSDGSKYYELGCRACKATLSFGQHKVGGTLFPKGEWKYYQKQDDLV
jgi:hypothetical protein